MFSKSILLFFLSLFSVFTFAQNAKRKPIIIEQKGFVFFSHNNAEYIDSLKYRHVIEQPYTRDIFIPSKALNNNKSAIENFITADLKHGVELGVFDQRETLRRKALALNNDTTGSICYKENSFAIMPVLIRYKKFSDFPKIYSCDNTVLLLNNKRLIRFSYETPSIEIMSITPLEPSSNK
jgi:hypothetical protein